MVVSCVLCTFLSQACGPDVDRSSELRTWAPVEPVKKPGTILDWAQASTLQTHTFQLWQPKWFECTITQMCREAAFKCYLSAINTVDHIFTPWPVSLVNIDLTSVGTAVVSLTVAWKDQSEGSSTLESCSPALYWRFCCYRFPPGIRKSRQWWMQQHLPVLARDWACRWPWRRRGSRPVASGLWFVHSLPEKCPPSGETKHVHHR